jgi:tetratricopeptide (TPR) repeat protein
MKTKILTLSFLLCISAAIAQADPIKEARKLVKQGNSMYRQKKLEQATVLFEKAIQLNDKNCDAQIGLGITYATRKMKDKATEAYKKFLELCPNDMRAPRVEETLKQSNVDVKSPGKKPGDCIPKRNSSPIFAKRKPGDKFGRIDVGISGGWAYVFIDGLGVRTTPLLNHAVKVGDHLVELKDGDCKVVKSWEIKVRHGKKNKLFYKSP